MSGPGIAHDGGRAEEDFAVETFADLFKDFSAHSNYCELALLELGYRDVFPHVGRDTKINLRGRRVYPLVTGTFGAVDFLHSVIG